MKGIKILKTYGKSRIKKAFVDIAVLKDVIKRYEIAQQMLDNTFPSVNSPLVDKDILKVKCTITL